MSEDRDRLDIDEDERVQRTTRVFERLEFWVFLLIIAGALIGVFGGGGLFERSSADSAGLRVTFPRFARYGAIAQVSLSFPPASGQRVVVRIDRSMSEEFNVESVVPEPVSVTVDGDDLSYEFAVHPSGAQGEAVFDLRPSKIGVKRLRFTGPRGHGAVATMVVFP